MKALLAQHLRALSAAMAKLSRAPVAGALNVAVFGIALSLPAGLYAALANLQRFAGNLDGKPQISIFLAADATRADIAAFESRLRKHSGVANAQFVSRERALDELRQQAGLGDIVELYKRKQRGADSKESPDRDAAARNAAGANPLPDTFVVDAKADDPRALAALRAEFAQWPKVEQATLDSAWAEKLAAALEFGRLAALFLGTLLSLALVAVIFNTIRLQILTLRDEVEVARLIGATDPFIRRPFLYYGAIQGLIGGLVALLIITAALGLLDDNMRVFATLYAADFRLQGLRFSDSVTLLVFSAMLGWLGARLSVGQHLTQAL